MSLPRAKTKSRRGTIRQINQNEEPFAEFFFFPSFLKDNEHFFPLLDFLKGHEH
jgi:hypothetical protein